MMSKFEFVLNCDFRAGDDNHRCYGAEVPDLAIVPVVDQVVLVHANAMAGGVQPVAILVGLETNIE